MSPRGADLQGQARASGDEGRFAVELLITCSWMLSIAVLVTLVDPYLWNTKLENESSMQNCSLTFPEVHI